MAFARTIIESHIAQKTIDGEIKRIHRLIDIYDGIKWRLARQPEGGYRVPKTNPPTWVMHSYHWGIAAVVLAYHFDDDQVEILDVKVELIH
jgi:hypothetical protein